MSFISTVFLWSAISLAIPIAIALWNRKRHRQERFGGFYLLKKVLETSKRRVQLLEILKLLNRLVLLFLLILAFAEPLQSLLRLSGAKEGFVIILDNSRVMQLGDLISEQDRAVRRILSQMPSEVQGSILFSSDTCLTKLHGENRQTALAKDWLEAWDINDVPYANAGFSSSGLASCLSRANSLFSDREILKVLISPLPGTIDLNILKDIQVERLTPPEVPEAPEFDLRQEAELERIRILSSSSAPTELALIDLTGRVEPIGRIEESLDLVPTQRSWLWARHENVSDPWIGNKLLSLRSFRVGQITLWASKETEGYLSLLSALRTHPNVQVVRQIGGEIIGDNVIVYGSLNQSLPVAERLWFFLSPNGESPFYVRDQKQWTPQTQSSDVRRSFEILTDDGKIFVRRYSLLGLDGLKVLETFEDGVPSLLESQKAQGRIWITPFDLEDLSTDLSLEPTFIPYLYKHLDRWMGTSTGSVSGTQAKAIWTMPGKLQPVDEILGLQKWPGVYQVGENYEVVEPASLPETFLTYEASDTTAEAIEEEVSLRPKIFQWLALSAFVELFLCLVSLKFIVFAMMLSFLLYEPSLMAQESVQRINIGVLSEMDGGRREALDQVLRDIDYMSNLEFSKSQVLSPQEFWKASAIVMASSSAWNGFRPKEREIVRDYLERGGLLIFDDPLAVQDSSFYQSINKELSFILPGRSLTAISKDDVLFRTFYLLNEVSGRRLASSNIEGIELDGRWVVLYSPNDLLGANLRSPQGDYTYSVSPYGIMQRILAKRMLLNFLMYSVTLDYKDDAIHLPHILKRRVR